MAVVFKKPKRTVHTVYIHCTDNDNVGLKGKALVGACTEWHRVRGWSTVGYHFMIDKLGQILKGRDIERIPAAQSGYNSGSIAICVHGKDISKFTQAAFSALIDICKQIDTAYGKGVITFRPHNHVSTKTCPNFDIYSVLKVSKSTGKFL